MFDGASNLQLRGDILKTIIKSLLLCVNFNPLFLFYSTMFQNTNCEPNDSSLQGNIKYIWIWNISQAIFYFQTKVL